MKKTQKMIPTYVALVLLKQKKKCVGEVKFLTDEQTDLTVNWGHKKHKDIFSEKPKSVDRKTNNIDRFVDRQAADVVFGDTLIGSRLSYILRDNDTIDLRDSLSAH